MFKAQVVVETLSFEEGRWGFFLFLDPKNLIHQ